MIVIVLTVSPPKLRGHLTRWLMEISPGVYVGIKSSVRTRQRKLVGVRPHVIGDMEEDSDAVYGDGGWFHAR